MKAPHALAVYITVSFIIGIMLGYYVHWELTAVYWIVGSAAVLFLIAFFREKRLFLQDKVFGIAGFLMLVSLGILNVQWHQPQNMASHYIHQNLDSPVNLRLQIQQNLKPTSYQNRYIAIVEQVGKEPTSGKVLLSVDRNPSSDNLQVDDCLALRAHLRDINPPLNPYGFDYAAYMAKKQVLKQVTASSEDFIKLEPQSRSLYGLAVDLRHNINNNLNKSGFSPEQIALIQALVLGQRSELSKETYTHFTEAGVVHVLAVSGLHIGILLFFLMFIFKPLTYLPAGAIIRSCLIILMLWGYAIVVGLTPSILRAVIMFSFLSLGLLFKRRIFTLNMLCLSALVLLFYRPGFIREIGFQLSYAAVLSILLFQNKIFSLLALKRKIWRYPWRIFSLTLAAQLGVLPLSLFYFHQFPGLFFLSNLVIVPFLGIILGIGVIVLIWINIASLPLIIITLYGGVLDLLQGMVDWVAEKEAFLVQHVYFSPQMLLLSLLLIGMLAFTLYRKPRIYLYLTLIAILLLQTDYLYEYQKIEKSREFYIFHKSRHTVLGIRNGHRLRVAISKSENKNNNLNLSFLEGLRNAFEIDSVSVTRFPQNYYIINGQEILIIDSTAIWQLPKLARPWAIVLSQSPKINLDRVVDSLKPQIVVADGSNYKNRLMHWQKTCVRKNIEFYYTGKEGAFQLSY